MGVKSDCAFFSGTVRRPDTHGHDAGINHAPSILHTTLPLARLVVFGPSSTVFADDSGKIDSRTSLYVWHTTWGPAWLSRVKRKCSDFHLRCIYVCAYVTCRRSGPTVLALNPQLGGRQAKPYCKVLTENRVYRTCMNGRRKQTPDPHPTRTIEDAIKCVAGRLPALESQRVATTPTICVNWGKGASPSGHPTHNMNGSNTLFVTNAAIWIPRNPNSHVSRPASTKKQNSPRATVTASKQLQHTAHSCSDLSLLLYLQKQNVHLSVKPNLFERGLLGRFTPLRPRSAMIARSRTVKRKVG